MRRGGARRDDGFATAAAVMAAACVALLAAQIARTSRSAVVGVNADAVRARLSAAADAGLATALDHVLADDPGSRWDIDGETYEVPFDAADLKITVEDERGKLPLNAITERQARAMFQLAGAEPSALDDLVAAFMAWRDPDRLRDPPAYATPVGDAESGSSGFRTVAELGELAGMTPAVYAAIAPVATVDAGPAAFDPRTASPFALKAMSGGGPSGVADIMRLRELAGQQSAFDRPQAVGLVGRVLTIRVEASDARGDRLESATLVQITGLPQHPYIVRQHYA